MLLKTVLQTLRTLITFRQTASAGIQVVGGEGIDECTCSRARSRHAPFFPGQHRNTTMADGFGNGINKVTVALPPSLATSGKLFVRLNVVVAGNE